MAYKVWNQMKYAVARNTDVLKEALANPEYCIQCKKDGASYIWAKDQDGSVHLYGDKISKKDGKIIDKIDNVPHLKAYAEKHFPKCSQILVEICYNYDWMTNTYSKRSNSKYVNAIMLALPKRATERQAATNPCEAYMFDILYWNGAEIYKQDYADRYAKMKEIFDDWCNTDRPEWITCADMITENKEEVIAGWLANGEEGGVLKLLHSQGRISAAYAVTEIGETPKRPMHTTYKIKQIDTIDVVIMGLEYPTKTYNGKAPDTYPYRDADGNPINRLYALGMINAFDIGLYDEDGDLVKIGTVASGLDDNTRLTAAEHPEEFIGTTIECSCMSIDKTGHSLRHPRLMRFRPDKEPEQCLWNDVFN